MVVNEEIRKLILEGASAIELKKGCHKRRHEDVEDERADKSKGRRHYN